MIMMIASSPPAIPRRRCTAVRLALMRAVCARNRAIHALNTIPCRCSWDDSVGVPYRPLYVSPFACDLLGELDNVIGQFGRINPTIQAAGKFHHDIAGSSAAAARDFGYDPRVTLADAAREMKDLL